MVLVMRSTLAHCRCFVLMWSIVLSLNAMVKVDHHIAKNGETFSTGVNVSFIINTNFKGNVSDDRPQEVTWKLTNEFTKFQLACRFIVVELRVQACSKEGLINKWDVIEGAYVWTLTLMSKQVGPGRYNATLHKGSSTTAYLPTFSFTVKDCTDPDDLPHVVNSGQAVYNKSSQFYCTRADAKLYYTFNATTARNDTRCNAFAEWENWNEVECWFAPNVTLKHMVDGKWTAQTEDQMFSSGDNLNLNCTFTGNGSPPTNSTEYLWNMKKISPTVELNSSHHEGNFSCRGVNNFTARNEGTGFSNVLQVKVRFSPEPPLTDCRPEGNQPQDLDFNVTFKSYPDVKNVSVIYIGQQTELKKIGNPSSTLQIYGGVLRNVYQKDIADIKLLRNYEGEIYNETLFKNGECIMESDQTTSAVMATATSGRITKATLGQSTKATSMTMTLIVPLASGGGVLFLIIIVLICIMVKKRQASGVKKEEVTNPIYDTTSVSQFASTSVPKSEKASEKEERENPLYGTTSNATYAPINKKKKKATTSNQQAEANETYASVNKIKEGKKKRKESDEQAKADETYVPLDKIKKGKKKKGADKNGQSNDGYSGAPEALYAAVNKKKDAAGGSDQPSTSGLGNNGDAAEECTYAAVQKKGNRKPKRDGSDDEDLHGSTKP